MSEEFACKYMLAFLVCAQVLFQEQAATGVKHQFEANTFYLPTFCHHCGSLLYGIVKQGLQCGGKNPTDSRSNIDSDFFRLQDECPQTMPGKCGWNLPSVEQKTKYTSQLTPLTNPQENHQIV